MTNAEYIREMSDDQLAEWIADFLIYTLGLLGLDTSGVDFYSEMDTIYEFLISEHEEEPPVS